jgi:hypothetical protein
VLKGEEGGLSFAACLPMRQLAVAYRTSVTAGCTCGADMRPQYRSCTGGTCAPLQDKRESALAPGNAWLHHAAVSFKAMAWLLCTLPCVWLVCFVTVSWHGTSCADAGVLCVGVCSIGVTLSLFLYRAARVCVCLFATLYVTHSHSFMKTGC